MGNVAGLITDATNLTAAVNEVFTVVSAEVDAEASARTQADNALDGRIDALIVGAGTSSAEVVDARGGETVLSNRLGDMEMRVYNVRRAPYNAVADGTTNDSPAISAAISDAKALGGGIVLIPAGVYALHSQPGGVDADNVTVQGSGAGTILRWKKPSGANTENALAFISSDHVTVRDLTIENTDDSQNVLTDSAIQFEVCDDCHVVNVRVIGHQDSSTTVNEGALPVAVNTFAFANGVEFDTCTNCTVTRSYFKKCRCAIRFAANQGICTHNSALNNTAVDCFRFFMCQAKSTYTEDDAIYDDDYGVLGAHWNQISHNRAIDIQQIFGKVENGCYWNEISHNVVTGGHNVARPSGQGCLTLSGAYSKAIGNSFNLPANVVDSVIFADTSAWHSIISKNIVDRSVSPGVYVETSCNDVLVQGNSISYSNGHGISVQAGGKNWKINGNNIWDCGLSGIRINGADDGQVQDNTIDDVVSQGIEASGMVRFVISGNKINNVGENGIRLSGTCTHGIINGNNIYNTNLANTAANSSQKAHIYIAASACDAIGIIGNLCVGFGGTTPGTVSIDGGSATNLLIGMNTMQGTIAGAGGAFTVTPDNLDF